jgi:hypothetical protein
MQTPTNFLLMEKLTDWLKQNNYEDKKAYFSDPMFVFYLDGDPWNNSRFVRCYSYLNWDWNHDIKPGELLIWDAQFTGYEGKLPFDSLVANKNFTLLKTFTPSENVVIIGGGYSKAAIFIRNNFDKLSNKTGN